MIRKSRKGKIYNPETGRWVKKNGRIGRRVSSMRFGSDSSKRRLIKTENRRGTMSEYYVNEETREKDGIYKEFFNTGYLYKIGNYVNGQKNGIWKTYFEGPGEKLSNKEQYENGILDGIYERWMPNGSILYKTEIKDGDYHGLFEEFYENGNVRNCGIFIKGERDGLWKEYYNDGTIHKKINYENGDYNGLYIRYYTDGDISEKGEYKDGQKNGVWEKWDYSGRIESRYKYKNGWNVGIYIPEDFDGIIEMILLVGVIEVLKELKADKRIKKFKSELESHIRHLRGMARDKERKNLRNMKDSERKEYLKKKAESKDDKSVNPGKEASVDLGGFLSRMSFGKQDNYEIYYKVCRDHMKNKWVSDPNRNFTWYNYSYNLVPRSSDYMYYNYCNPNEHDIDDDELYLYEMILAKMNEMGY